MVKYTWLACKEDTPTDVHVNLDLGVLRQMLAAILL